MKRKIKTPDTPVVTDAAHDAKTMAVLPNFSGWNRLFIYPLCVLFPSAGLVLAALYLKQDDHEHSGFGKVCLVLAILGGILRMCHVQNFQSLENSDALTQPFY